METRGEEGRGREAADLLRRTLVSNVTNVDLWRELWTSLETAGQGVESGLMRAAIDALGSAAEGERQAAQAARRHLGAPAPGAFGPQMLAMIAEGAMDGPPMRLLETLLGPIAKLYPPDLSAMGLGKRERIAPRSMDVLRPLVDDVAAIFGAPEVDVYATESNAPMVQLLAGTPPILVLSRHLERLGDSEQAFIVARAMAAIAGRFHPAHFLSARDLALLFAAAGHSTDPTFGGVANPEELEQLAQTLRKAFSWLASRKPFEEAAAAYVQAPLTNMADWLLRLEQTAARAAAAVTRDLSAAMRVLKFRTPSGGVSYIASVQGAYLVEDSPCTNDFTAIYGSAFMARLEP